MASSMTFDRIDRTLVVVHGTDSPSDVEWEHWMRRMAQLDYDSLLVMTSGGAPSPKQRSLANDFWAGKRMPRMAVITDSATVRGALFAFYWLFKTNMKPFAPLHADDALDFLGIAYRDHGKVMTVASNMQQQVH